MASTMLPDEPVSAIFNELEVIGDTQTDERQQLKQEVKAGMDVNNSASQNLILLCQIQFSQNM